MAEENKPRFLLQVVQDSDKDPILTFINSHALKDYRAFGLIVTDIVRNIAMAFKVSEDEVWEWVDKERYHPTTQITEVKPS